MSEYPEELRLCEVADCIEYGDTEPPLPPHSAPPDDVDAQLVARCSLQPLNDTGNGRRLLLYFGDKLVNVEEAESARAAGWHRWAGTHWTAKGGIKAAMHAAQITAERIALETDYIDPIPREDEATYHGRLNRRRQFGIGSGNDARIRAMLNQATVKRTISQKDLDRDAYAFNVANGTLRFVCELAEDAENPGDELPNVVKRWSARLDRHNPDDLISKVAPVEYKLGEKAPKFLESLERFQPSAAVRDWLQRYYGYGITGLHGEQCLVFHGGGGSNWKSTFTEIIFRVIGDYGTTLKIESLAGESQSTGNGASPDIARLPGARLVRASEPDQGVPLKESLIKSITGGEPMLARHNFGNFFEFYPVFKLTIAGNHKPKIAGVDHGIWRRMRYVVWPVTIRDEEKREFDEVIAELWEEREGILAWLVEGAIKYLSEGLKPPAEIIEATREYRDEMDSVGPFLEQCTETMSKPTGDIPQHRVSCRGLYDHYVNWCHWEGRRAWKENTFANAMSQKGFDKERDNKGRWYLNLRMTTIPSARSREDEPLQPTDEEVPG